MYRRMRGNITVVVSSPIYSCTTNIVNKECVKIVKNKDS